MGINLTAFLMGNVIHSHINNQLTLIIKSVYPVNAGTLVVATKKKEVFRIFDLVCQEKTNGF